MVNVLDNELHTHTHTHTHTQTNNVKILSADAAEEQTLQQILTFLHP